MGKGSTIPAVTPDNSGNEASKKTKENTTQQKNKNKNKTGSNPKTDTNKYQTFKGKTKCIEDDIFFYGKNMNSKFVTSKEAILTWICTKYSASKKASIETGNIVILGMLQPTQYATRAEFDALKFFEQEYQVDNTT